jgi:hypothetical protein
VLRVELDGSVGAWIRNGVHLSASDSAIRGLVVNRFQGVGVLLFLGSFSAGYPNRGRVEGNYVGTDVSGTVALGNGTGVLVAFDPARFHTIGGTAAAARNVISGNTEVGLDLFASRATVQGNYIGTDARGRSPLGNGLSSAAAGITESSAAKETGYNRSGILA